MATFTAAVERWRPYIKKHSPDFPEDFVLAWIKKESGGGASKGGWYTKMDERGIFQIHPDTAKSLGITGSDWEFLNVFPGYPAFDGYDFDRHYRLSVKQLYHYRKRANELLDDVGAHFSARDILAVTKLLHGLPVIVSKGLKDYVKAHGGSPPPSFDVWVAWLRKTGWSYEAWGASRISEIIGNTEKVMSSVDDSTVAVVVGLGVVGGLVGWFLGKRKG